MSTAIRASDFENSIGVNVHVEYTDGQYANAAAVVQDLQYLGIDHVRDAALNPANQGQSSYGLLANAGIKFDMIMLGQNIGSTLQLIDNFDAAHPGAVSAIEGPNEINNWAISYNGMSGNTAGVAYQDALYGAVKANPLLGQLPIYNLTNDSYLSASSNDVNVHAYPFNGAQPFQALAAGLASTPGVSATEGAVLTEAGYYTLTNGTGWGGVSDQAQATMTLNLLFDATKLGYGQTYLYQLLDAYSDPNGTNPDDHFGLFNLDNTPKPVAIALHNLSAILDDTGSNASSFTTGSLNYSVANLPTTGSSMLLEKSSGAYDIVVWNEPTVWNATTETAVTAPTTSVTVNLGGTYANVSVYDPMTGTTAIASAHDASSIQIGLTDHPLVVEVSGLETATAASTASTAAASSANATMASTFHGPSLYAPDAGGALVGGVGYHLYGGAGADTLNDGGGPAYMVGGAGNDYYNVNNVNDVIVEQANQGTDTISSTVSYTIPTNVENMAMKGMAALTGTGNSAANVIVANNGGDVLNGMDGNDTLVGGAGNDTLNGGAGNDVLEAGTGTATLTGGAGADKFAFLALADFGTGHDVITDFNASEGDQIDLYMMDTALVAEGLPRLHFIGAAAFSHTAGELHYTTDSSGLTLSGDINGDGVADFSLHLANVHTLSAASLVL